MLGLLVAAAKIVVFKESTCIDLGSLPFLF